MIDWNYLILAPLTSVFAPLVGAFLVLFLARFRMRGEFPLSLAVWAFVVWSVWHTHSHWPVDFSTTGTSGQTPLIASLGSHLRLSIEDLSFLKVFSIAGLLLSALVYYHGKDDNPPGVDLAGVMIGISAVTVLLLASSLGAITLGVLLFGSSGPLVLGMRRPQWSTSTLRYMLGFGLGFCLVLLSVLLIMLTFPTMNITIIEEVIIGSSAGSLGLTLLAVGTAICLGWGPLNVLFPSIYATAPVTVSTFLDILGKIGFVCFVYNLLPLFKTVSFGGFTLVGFLGALTMAWGAMGATGETRLARLFYYAGLVHGGFILLVTDPGVYPFALAMYLFTFLGLYTLVSFLEQTYNFPDVHHLCGMGLRFPYLGAMVTILLLSMAGLAPSGAYLLRWKGSIGIETSATLLALIPWLAIILAAMRVLFLMYARSPQGEFKQEGGISGYYVLLALSIGAVGAATFIPSWFGG